MSSDRVGTSKCGWCIGPPGARIPHRRGFPSNCPCACHDERNEE